MLEVYLWLARRYESEGVFVDEAEAREEMQACCLQIESQLSLNPLLSFHKPSKPSQPSKRRR